MTTYTFPHWTLGLLAFEKRRLVQLNTHTSVSEALSIMQRENVMAAPLWDDAKKQFTAIVNMPDLVSLVAFGCFQQQQQQSSDASSASPSLERFREIDQPVADWVIGLHDNANQDDSVSNSLVIHKSSDSIQSILPLMSSGTHHLIVQMESHESEIEYRMISQTDVLRFLSAFGPRWRHAAWSNQCNDRPFPDILSRRVNQLNLNLQSTNVFVLPINITALEAFQLLDKNRVRAAPILNTDGTVLTTLSVSDLRGLRSSNLKTVTRPLLDFLQQHRGDFHMSFTIAENDTIQTALMHLVTYHVHRLWVVDDSGKVIGVLAMTDLIRLFANELN